MSILENNIEDYNEKITQVFNELNLIIENLSLSLNANFELLLKKISIIL